MSKMIRINLKLMNGLLLAQFIGLTAFCLTIDAIHINSGGYTNVNYWSWTGSFFEGPVRWFILFLQIVLGIAASLVFITFVYRYNKTRRAKKDKYLASLVLITALYQGISRIFDIFANAGNSDFRFTKDIIIKSFFPLDILGSVLFVIVVFQVFLVPSMQEEKSRKTMIFLMVIGILADYIGVATSTFSRVQDKGSFYIIFNMILTFFVWGVIAVVVLATFKNVLVLRHRVNDPAYKKSLLTISMQVLLVGCVHVFLILHETGSFLGMPWETYNILRVFKVGTYLLLAILYSYSFIKPEANKSEN